MKKTNNVVEFVKNHKKEVLIATTASVVGIVGGIVGGLLLGKLPEQAIRRLFATVVLISGMIMLFR